MSSRRSTLEVSIGILRHEGRPLRVDEIVDRVLKTEGVRLTGKTPKDSIAARLYVEAKKPDGAVELVAPGTFKIRDRG